MRKWMPLIAVCLGTFMLLVDTCLAGFLQLRATKTAPETHGLRGCLCLGLDGEAARAASNRSERCCPVPYCLPSHA
jgi:hypothetical protein